jgi:NADPH2:quinone reductase
MSMMRAALVRSWGGPEAVEVAEIPRPVPKPGEVLVEVKAVSINYVDLIVIAGRYQFKPELPFTPGKGPAGIVVAVGEGVASPKVGDRVLAMAEIGSYAQYAIAPANQCYQLPDAMPFADAAAMALAYDTAWFALHERCRLQAGETVLVLGASGAVGHAAVMLAKAAGARVLAGIANPAKAQLVREAGADAVIDLAAPDLRENLRDQVRAATGGRGVDVCVDMLGDVYFDAALRALAWCGRLCVVGFAGGRIPELKANYLLVKNIEVNGLQISDYRKRRPQRVAEAFADIFALHAAGKVKAMPMETFPLPRVADALARLAARPPGRVVLLPGDAA